MKDSSVDRFWMILLPTLWIAGLLGWVLFFAGCSPLLQGEPIDLAQVATPPVVRTPPPLPGTSPVVDVSRARERAWVPREVFPNGDTVEGHYLEVSPQAPDEEAIAPAVHVPRAPKQVFSAPKASTKVRTLPAPSPEPPLASPQVLPYVPQPGVNVTVPLHGGTP